MRTSGRKLATRIQSSNIAVTKAGAKAKRRGIDWVSGLLQLLRGRCQDNEAGAASPSQNQAWDIIALRRKTTMLKNGQTQLKEKEPFSGKTSCLFENGKRFKPTLLKPIKGVRAQLVDVV